MCFSFIFPKTGFSNVPLNDSNFELKVNFLECKEVTAKGKERNFSWVTDIEISTDNIQQLMRGGRSRWKIENETFNTLKNQGYQFEHNFGHGNKYLSTIFSQLMLLAFLIDQIQAIACSVFEQALKEKKSKTVLWFSMRAIFYHFLIDSWEIMYRMVIAPPNTRPVFDTG